MSVGAGAELVTADAVVTGLEVLRPGWLELQDGRVVALGAGPAPRAADRPLGGATVVPGFVDIHGHGGGGASYADGTAAATSTARGLHRRHGTTSAVASLVSASPDILVRQVRALADQVEEGLLAGIHLEGPWLAPERRGAHDPTALRVPDPAEVDAVIAAGRGTIAMVTLAPELPGASEAIARFVDAGVVVAVGHTDGSYADARAAVDAGARVATHLFNAMRPVHHREPGPVIALLEDERVTVELITDGTHVHPALYRHVVASAGADRVALVTDAMAAAGMADGDYRLGSLAVEVAGRVARLAGTDTIAGSTATSDLLFRFALEHGEAEGDDALLATVRQTSVIPSRALGLPDPVLAVGSPANLAVLDQSFAVTAVASQGRWEAGAGTSW